MTQLQSVENFIARSKHIRSFGELHSLMDDITRELGFDYFALAHHVDLSSYNPAYRYINDSACIAVTTYPSDWIDEIIRDGMKENDPIRLICHRRTVAFAWNDIPELIPLTPEQRIKVQRVTTGIIDGYTVPAHFPDGTEGSGHFVVAGGRTIASTNLLMAQLVSMHAFHAANQIAGRAASTSAASPDLTSRQRDCVWLVSLGYSDRKIADLLAISIETVKQHLKESRDRLHAVNRAQLVVRAAYHGIIPLKEMIVK